MKASYQIIFLLGTVLVLILSACTSQENVSAAVDENVESISEASDTTVVSFTLKTIANNGKLAYLGISGEIDGIVNPDLFVQVGSDVQIILVNGDGMPHDLFLPDFDTKTDYVIKIGDQTEIEFEVGEVQPGVYVYYCTVPGHRQAGQEGKFVVTGSQE